MGARPLVWLLDGHFQIFRAYYALPDLRAPDGSPVGAARGYAQTLIRFLCDQAPTHVAVAFDHDLTSFRNELYPEYKLGRTDAPEDLEPQFALCVELTRALGIPAFSLERFEADDVLATLVGRLRDVAEVAIVTRDKDLAALVSDGVALYDLARAERSGPREVEEKLGVPPALVPDYLALVGDAVDNVPGVRGIGARTASTLLRHFGGIDRLPRDGAGWDALPLRGAARVAELLRAGRAGLELSRELVRLRDDLPLSVSLDALRWRGGDRAAFEPLAERLGFAAFAARVPRWAA